MAFEWTFSRIALIVYLGSTIILLIVLSIMAYLKTTKENKEQINLEQSKEQGTPHTQQNKKDINTVSVVSASDDQQQTDTKIDIKSNTTTKSKKKSKWKDLSKYLQTVWKMRSIYGAILVHLYDTRHVQMLIYIHHPKTKNLHTTNSTDIAVVVAWTELTHKQLNGDVDYPNIQMLSFLIPAILSMFVYRIMFVMYYCGMLYKSIYFDRCDVLMILTDTYIFRVAYESFKEDYTEPCILQKNLQMWESVFESMPQLILQTVFLIKTYDTPQLADSNSMTLVILSIVASTISVVSKYMWYDGAWVVDHARDVHFRLKKCKFPFCISWSYAGRILWRFSELLLRFIIFSLLWVVCGGIYLIIYILLSFFVYFLLEHYTLWIWISAKLGTKKAIHEGVNAMIINILQCVVGIPLRRHLRMNIIRFVDNLCIFCVILIIAIQKVGSIECDIDFFCNNTNNKYASHNPYVSTLLIIGAIALVFEICIYACLYFQNFVVSEMHIENATINKSRHGQQYKLPKKQELLTRFHPRWLKIALAHQDEESEQKMKEKIDLDPLQKGGVIMPRSRANIIRHLDKPEKKRKQMPDFRAVSISAGVFHTGDDNETSDSSNRINGADGNNLKTEDAEPNETGIDDKEVEQGKEAGGIEMPVDCMYGQMFDAVNVPTIKKETTSDKNQNENNENVKNESEKVEAIPIELPFDCMYGKMFDAVQAPVIKSIDDKVE